MKTLLATLITALFSTAIIAQDFVEERPAEFQKWNLGTMSWSVGIDWNEYSTMSLNELMGMATDPAEVGRDLEGMNEEANAHTAGLVTYTSVSLSPRDFVSGEVNTNQQINIGIALYSDQEAMVSYKSEEMDTSIVFCNAHSQIALDGSYTFNTTLGKRLYVYAGGGVTSGFTYGNEMIVMEGKYFKEGAHPSTQEILPENKAVYDAKALYYYRLYVPYGMHLKFTDNFSMGLDFRRGIGWQKAQGEKSNFIESSGSFQIGGKFHF